jgi:hypothetical protein
LGILGDCWARICHPGLILRPRRFDLKFSFSGNVFRPCWHFVCLPSPHLHRVYLVDLVGIAGSSASGGLPDRLSLDQPGNAVAAFGNLDCFYSGITKTRIFSAPEGFTLQFIRVCNRVRFECRHFSKRLSFSGV